MYRFIYYPIDIDEILGFLCCANNDIFTCETINDIFTCEDNNDVKSARNKL